MDFPTGIVIDLHLRENHGFASQRLPPGLRIEQLHKGKMGANLD
jgi:hypothetical protein